MFLKQYQSRTNIMNNSNSVDMIFRTTILPFCPRDYIQRVSYQVFVWIHSCENKQDLPDLDKSGWKIYGEEIEYDWVKGSLIIPE